ncbi:MAG: hypothetical protein JXA68_08175 [Ignavibacteriales bacterium]|nr:hypothetical protein [Ignavibacteriales bacterium]
MIYRLLDIKYNSIKLIIVLLPPIYSLWLLALGKRILEKMSVSDIFFSFVTIVFFLISLVSIILWPFISLEYFSNHQFEFSIIALISLLIFIISITILSYYTIKFERHQMTDNYYSLRDAGDYIKRFFSFFFWPIFIWTLQKTIKLYNLK